MLYKAAFPGKYIQGAGVFVELHDVIKFFANNQLVLASPTVISSIIPRFGRIIIENNYFIENVNGECSEIEVSRLSNLILKNQNDVIIGIGGGKLIDTAKMLADFNANSALEIYSGLNQYKN